MTKPGIDQLLIASALQADLRQRLADAPEEVFQEFDLTEEEMDLLRRPDHRLLALLGAALARQADSYPPGPEAPDEAPPPTPIHARTLPDITLVLTVVPYAKPGNGSAYTVWVNHLPEGADPPAVIPGQPLQAVIQVSAIEQREPDGSLQIGLWAWLRQSSNVAAPPPPEVAGRPSDRLDRRTDIWIAGLGIQAASQVTPEVERAIRASREVFYLDTGVATRPFLEALCPRVTSLYEESYAEEGPRVSAYEHMAARVIDAALDHPPVTFALHGHPLVGMRPPFLVLDRARALNLAVEVLPGISAIDTLLADLRIDPVVHGVQMYEATDMLLRRRPLQSDVPAILWQIGPLETCLHTMRVSRPERFDRLVGHLLQFYPQGHEVVAVYCSPHPLMPPTILRFALEDMGRHAHQIHHGFTLYVPPSASRPIQDCDLLGKLTSVKHLRSITR